MSHHPQRWSGWPGGPLKAGSSGLFAALAALIVGSLTGQTRPARDHRRRTLAPHIVIPASNTRLLEVKRQPGAPSFPQRPSADAAGPAHETGASAPCRPAPAGSWHTPHMPNLLVRRARSLRAARAAASQAQLRGHATPTTE